MPGGVSWHFWKPLAASGVRPSQEEGEKKLLWASKDLGKLKKLRDEVQRYKDGAKKLTAELQKPTSLRALFENLSQKLQNYKLSVEDCL